MRKMLLPLVACFMLAPPAHAQACPSTKTLDELIQAVDDAVSGPVDKDRSCLRRVMLPDARLIPVARAKDGSAAPHVLTVDDWISRVKVSGHGQFYEVQIKHPADVYGNIAHLWSTYEVRPTPDGKPEIRGINSIQAVFNGTEWKVMEILWQAETPGEPLPQKYLP